MNSAAAPAPLPLLGYTPFSAPTPIQVSTVTAKAQATLDLVITVPTSPVYCNQLLIAVPVGTSADTLCTQPPTLAVNTAKWAISTMKIQTGGNLGLVSTLSYATWTCQTVNAADNAITYPLVFSLVATVNQAVGACDLVVQETSGTTSDPTTYTTKKSTIPVHKAPPQFQLHNFMATAPGSPLVPVSEFANGAPMYFSWESNGNYFQLFAKNNPTPIYSGTTTNFTLSVGAATDTTFILMASVSGDPAGGGGNGFAPIYLYDTLTITITNADSTPRSLAVANNATVGGTLGVTGALTSAALVTANAGLKVSGGATVSGGMNLDTLAATGAVTAGSIQTPSLNASNAALSALTCSGPVGMMAGYQGKSFGTAYTAPSDGFVVACTWWASTTDAFCRTALFGYVNGALITSCNGGNMGLFKVNSSSDWTSYIGVNPNTMCFPVPKGATWQVTLQPDAVNQVQLSGPTLYFVPFGTAVTAAEVAQTQVASVPSSAARRQESDVNANIDDLVNAFGSALGTTFPDSVRKDLARSILKLVQLQNPEAPASSPR